jgi:hypothetical protein
MLAGGFQAPLTKAAGLFQAFTRNLAYGVRALIDQREADEPADAEASDSSEPSEPSEPSDAAESPESSESESESQSEE